MRIEDRKIGVEKWGEADAAAPRLAQCNEDPAPLGRQPTSDEIAEAISLLCVPPSNSVFFSLQSFCLKKPMPISTPIPIRHLSQSEFGEIAYAVMEQVFAIHKEFGRFFDEKIYKRELARRMAGVTLEVPVDVTFGSFTKRYFLDVLMGGGALFEFKCAEEIHPRHRAQLLHYLLLLDLNHGKLINMRTEAVQHEFVNATLTTAARGQFTVDTARWRARSEGAAQLEGILIPMLRELGTGLDLNLYEEALAHLLGGAATMLRDVPVASADDTPLGVQTMRLITAASAFKLTAFKTFQPAYAEHCRRLLTHLPLKAIQWANIAHRQVTLTTIERQGMQTEKLEREK